MSYVDIVDAEDAFRTKLGKLLAARGVLASIRRQADRLFIVVRRPNGTVFDGSVRVVSDFYFESESGTVGTMHDLVSRILQRKRSRRTEER